MVVKYASNTLKELMMSIWLIMT